MTRTSRRPARTTIITSTLVAAALCFAPVTPALAAGAADTPAAAEQAATDHSAALAATPWETTAATDQDGNPVALDDARAANFVGWAYFKQGGTFTMYTLDDKPKMQGDWTVAPDGSSRWIAAKNDAGDVLFERTVPIVTLTADEFTYRVIDQADPTQWVDIVHTPTTHQEPAGGGETNPGGGGEETPGGTGGTGGTGDGSTPTPEPGDTGGADGTAGTGTTGGTGGTGTTGGTDDAAAAAPGGTGPDGAKGHTADTLAATGGSGLLVSAAASALAILGGAILFVRRALAGARG